MNRLIVAGLFLLLFSCVNVSEENWEAQVIGCWEVDSLYFRIGIKDEWQDELLELQRKAKDNACFEFGTDGKCRFLIDAEPLEGSWQIEGFYLKVIIEKQTESYFRLVELEEEELIVEFPIVVGGGQSLPLVQKMKPCQKSLEEMMAEHQSESCGQDPFKSALQPFTPLTHVYFHIPTAENCAKAQNKPILYCYLDGKDKLSAMVHYRILTLPRLQKFMHRKLTTLIHFTDMSVGLPGAAEQLQSQADSLERWSAKPPFFVLRDPQTLEMLDSLTNPGDDIEFKRFLIEALGDQAQQR